jgi:hypothetical protein
MAVTVEVTTEQRNRRGEYQTGTYLASRCADFPAALAFARKQWQYHARAGVTARVTYRGDNGTVIRRAELRAG